MIADTTSWKERPVDEARRIDWFDPQTLCCKPTTHRSEGRRGHRATMMERTAPLPTSASCTPDPFPRKSAFVAAWGSGSSQSLICGAYSDYVGPGRKSIRLNRPMLNFLPASLGWLRCLKLRAGDNLTGELVGQSLLQFGLHR